MGEAGRRLLDVESTRSTRATAGSICRTRKRAGLHGAASATEPRQRRSLASQGGRGRGGPPDPPSMTVIVRGKINGEQRVGGPAGHLPRHTRALQLHQRAFRIALHLRQQAPVLLARRQGRDGERAGPREPARQDPSGQRRRLRAEGQSVRERPGALPTIWSYGHRNPQGLAWDPVTGKLWESEHGPQGGDEINVIEPGRNYGWGVITMGSRRASPSGRRKGWSRRSSTTRRRSARAASSSTPEPVSGLEEQLVRQRAGGQQLAGWKSGAARSRTRKWCSSSSGACTTSSGPGRILYVTLQLPGQVISDSTPGMVARLVPQCRLSGVRAAGGRRDSSGGAELDE